MNYCERCRVGLNRQRAARPHSWQLSRYDSLRMPRAAGRVERAHGCNSSKFNVSADNRLPRCPLELVPPRRIVMSWCYAFGGEPEEHARTSRLEIDVAPIADGTELSFTHSGLFGEVSEESHAWGWSGSLDKLVRHVERAASSAGLTLEERE